MEGCATWTASRIWRLPASPACERGRAEAPAAASGVAGPAGFAVPRSAETTTSTPWAPGRVVMRVTICFSASWATAMTRARISAARRCASARSAGSFARAQMRSSQRSLRGELRDVVDRLAVELGELARRATGR